MEKHCIMKELEYKCRKFKLLTKAGPNGQDFIYLKYQGYIVLHVELVKFHKTKHKTTGTLSTRLDKAGASVGCSYQYW